jgi:hypothetical protein
MPDTYQRLSNGPKEETSRELFQVLKTYSLLRKWYFDTNTK